MNTLIYTLGLKPFFPPKGNIQIHIAGRNSDVLSSVDLVKKAVYQLVCEGFETDDEIAKELYRSRNSVRSYLKELMAEGVVHRTEQKYKKMRYYPSYIPLPELEPAPQIPARNSAKSKSIRQEYIELIKSGINTSVSIAKARNATPGGVITTLYRMRKAGLVIQNGEEKMNGVLTPLVIWEVV